MSGSCSKIAAVPCMKNIPGRYEKVSYLTRTYAVSASSSSASITVDRSTTRTMATLG